jgi:hypothetical protein
VSHSNQLINPKHLKRVQAFKWAKPASVGFTIMGKTADLTFVQKTIIETLHKEGKPQKVIAKEVGCSQSAVCGRAKCGRKRCTSSRDDRNLERIVCKRPFKSVGELHKDWTEAGVSASRAATHRQIYEMGFKCRIPLVKPLLNKKQHQKRLTWAKEKLVR